MTIRESIQLAREIVAIVLFSAICVAGVVIAVALHDGVRP